MTAITARIGHVDWRGPKAVGILGIGLGALAFWIVLPPVTTRSPLLSVLIGILAIFAGIWAVSREQKRVGWGAVAAGLAGIFFGVLATYSSTTNLSAVVVWSALISATLRYATPLIYAAIGGLYCERSGVVNVGLEGMLLTGAFFGIWTIIWAHSWAGGFAWVIALGGAALAGMVMATVLAVWSISLKVDQIITGTAINFLALGITGYIFIDKYGQSGTPGNITDYGIPDIHLNFLNNWYFIGAIFGQLNLMIWLSWALLIGTYFFVFRTPYGLRLRSVGEHPRAADVYSFSENMTQGIGFIGLAALVFGKWRPMMTYAATLLFGFCSALADRLPTAYGDQWGTLFNALPYVLTIIAVAGVIGRSVGPAAAGRPYDKQ